MKSELLSLLQIITNNQLASVKLSQHVLGVRFFTTRRINTWMMSAISCWSMAPFLSMSYRRNASSNFSDGFPLCVTLIACQYNDHVTTGVPRILQWRAFTSWGAGPGGLGAPEAEAKCEISVQFQTFSCIKLDLINIREGIGEYILQTHNTNTLKIQPLFWVRQCM